MGDKLSAIADTLSLIGAELIVGSKGVKELSAWIKDTIKEKSLYKREAHEVPIPKEFVGTMTTAELLKVMREASKNTLLDKTKWSINDSGGKFRLEIQGQD